LEFSRLYSLKQEPADSLRYAHRDQPAQRPVVVFNCTRRCNLRCVHCYSASTDKTDDDELDGGEVAGMIDDLAAYGVPVLLLSGGEPLLRPDVFELIAHARANGIRVALSTNGTLISPAVASRLAKADLSYAGISLDGIGSSNDAFRGMDGAFDAALAGIGNCRDAGVKVGLRMTLTGQNVDQLPAIFAFLRDQCIERVCFYHLVAAGRASAGKALPHSQTRQAVDAVIDFAAAEAASGRSTQVLTVDNHADGPYLLMRLWRQDASRAERAAELLGANGGNASGQRIACIGWSGDVTPDQFWRDAVLGNLRQRPFSRIWSDDSIELLAKLRDRRSHIRGRCTRCRWYDVCNGNLRARAAAAGDAWGDDPGCYLTDQEIAG